MRTALVLGLLLSGACRLALDPADYTFDEDAGVVDALTADVPPDTLDGEGGAPECAEDTDCTQPNMVGICAEGTCAFSCDDGFEDCDGFAMNGCESNLQSSVTTCGSCGSTCDGSHGEPSCAMGVCEVSCDLGFEDCNDDPSDGCEADLTTPASCGACTACPSSTPLCDSIGESPVCVADCGAETRCGDRCVNTEMSLADCGMCDMVCEDPDHASPMCLEGAACDTGFADCMGDSDGCETAIDTLENCGSCGNACTGLNVDIWQCTTGSCEIDIETRG